MKEIRKELNRVIAALLLSLFMSFNIFGAGIEVDPNVPQNVNVDKAPNGVPVINISTPTDKGTSINSFKEFNVDQRGVEILNNTGVGRGHLSGIVNPNPNLRPGQEARTVVFKVTGANRSEIEGYISALSPRPINLFIANENGIYVNGGGFINVNRAALVTGKINIQDGDVVSFTTRDGKVIIGEKGLDISNVERVDIITRTQELAGKIVGQKDVNIILGQNEVNLAGIVTPIITADNKPALSLNGGALGSIYSNGQVNIISTEKGVGVNLKSSVLSENDIRMKINGNADVKEIISKNAEIQTEDLKTDKINANNLNITAKDYENRKEITAQNVNISSTNFKNNELTAGNLTLNTGNAESNKISANSVNITGNNLKTNVMEGQNISLAISNNINNTGNIVAGTLNVSAKDFDNKEIVANNLNLNTSGKIQSNKINSNTSNIKGQDIISNEIETGILKLQGNNIQSNKITGNEVEIKGNNLKTNVIEGKNVDLTVNNNIHNTQNITAGKLKINSSNLINNEINASELNINTGQNIDSNNIRAAKATINATDIKSNKITSNDLKVTGNTFLNNDKVDATSADFNLQNDFTTKGTVSTDKLTVKSNNVVNDGKILSGSANISVKEKVINNDTVNIGKLDVNAKSLENKKDIRTNNLNITTNENTVNTGTITANNVTVNAGSVVNTNKIETESLNIKTRGNTENSGQILSNNLTVSSDNFINKNEISVDKGTITANNVIKNENKINANELTTNSRSLVNEKKIEVGTGTFTTTEDIENKDLLAGNNLKFKGRNLLNSEGKTIFATNKLEADMTGNVVNKKAEILSQNEIDLKADIIDNTVGKIKGTGDVKLTGRKIENVGEVGDLTKYKLYWETWNGKRFDSYADVATPEKGWTIIPRETLSGSTGDKESTFEYFLNNFGGADGVSYIFKELDKVVRQKKYTQQGTIAVNSTEYPVVPLMNKIESEAKTNHAVISGKNITLNAGEELNNTDGIISASEINKIDAPKIVHKVTIDENNPISLTDGAEKLIWWKTSHHGKSRYPVNYERYLVPSSRVGYVAGQPSIIEGKEVLIDKTKIVSERFDSAKGQIIKNAGTQNNVTGKNIEIVKNVSGIQDIKNTGIISVNIGSISGINGVNVNTGINNRNGINIGSLYVPSTDPSSRYVIENRTEFITRGNYYGGDYFLSRMGYVEDWDRVKLLGDAYYDNMLIEQTLTEKLGTRYINGLSGEELTKQLIDNATTAKKDLQLRQGVALTRDQINNLKNDIIWYEYETVNGKKTLVPKIYLSKATIEKLEVDGRSKIYGTEKTIIKASQDFENTGIKIGSKTGITEVTGDRIKNETVTNERAEIVGKKVKVEALTGNIENVGGKIVAVEKVELTAKNGDIINDGKKIKEGYYLDSKNHTEYETVSNIGEISAESVRLETNNYNSTGGALATKNLELQLTGNINENALELKGSDRFGDDKNYQKYKAKEYVGSGIVAEKATGKVGDINLKGSAFVVEDGKGLKVGNVKAESLVNEYDVEKRTKEKGILSKRESLTQSHTEENVSSNFKIGENADIKGTVTGIGSNIYIGDNSYVGGKVTTDSRELHNTYYNEEKKSGFSASAKGTSVSAGYGKSKNTYDEKSTINAKSSLHVGNNTVLNNGASITATDFEHGKIEINNGDVTYGARKDTRDVSTSSKSSYIGVTASVKSPALDRVKQAKEAVDQIKKGDTVGGAVNAVNFVTGTVHGLAGNQGNRQRNYDKNGSVGKQGVKDASANNNFYANIGLDVGFNTSKSETKSHEESAVVTTIKGIDGDSSITYNNVKNINYMGAQAKDTKFIYNDVENINKEAVELHNSYSSNSKGFGISAGATVGYGHKIQTTGNGGSVSVTRSNMNTEETLYQNGRFTNVDEVHNNTKNMRLSGFNQEGGKVTGTIENLVEESKQNISKTTGSSSGVTIGVGSNGVPSSASISGSRTNGNRAYVDNQTTFILGEGSNLTIGKAENTAGIIGVEGNGKLKINEYKGTDLYNHDNLTTTGGSIGVDFGKGGAKVNGIGVNNENHRKEGITRHTVIGNVEIGSATGSPINRDLSKANETTKDTHKSTNINIESQTIEYALNPGKFKEDLGKAKDEIKDIGRAIKESLNDRGDDNRNFLGQLSEGRLQRTIENIGGERLRKSTTQEDISKTLKDTYKDLGYDIEIIFTTPDKAPQLIDEKGKIKAGTAYVGKDGKHTIIINTEAKENQDRAGLIGTITEEGSHVIGKVEGRQRKVPEGSEEKGLESTGRATNDFFNKTYEEGNIPIQTKSDGKDYSKADFGEHVGDEKGACYKGGRILINCKVPPTMADFRILDQEHLKRDKNKLQKIREISKVEKKIEESKTPEEKAALKKRLDKLEGKNKNFSSFISGFKEETKESTPLGIVIGVAEKLNPVAALFFATSTPVNTNEEQLLHGIRKPQYSTKDAEYIKNNYPEMYPEIKGSINPKIKEFNKKAVDVSATKFYGKDEENANEFGKFLGSIVGFEAGRGAANTVINTGVKYYSSSSKSLFEKGHSEEIGKNLNDYASSKSNPNKRYTASESEAELTTRLKEMYKDKPNTTIETQESYKGGENVKYGIKGSVRPENSVVENGIVKETYEIKNYNQENYNSMTSNIGKQAIKRAEELPETATQKIVIDTRGQKITPEIRQKITEDIIRKSNKIIKKRKYNIYGIK